MKKKKYNIIFNITTSCNYNCSYCDVVKNKKKFSKKALEELLVFIKNNDDYIERFKFFGGEPLLAWKNIKYIINNSVKYIGNNYEIVTNTSLLKDEIGEYFEKYFKIIFFSIDSENEFNYEKISIFIKKYNLINKIYFNLIISPGKEKQALEQFYKLYKLGFKGFNILPVYFTKFWTDRNLRELSLVIKKILDLSLIDNKLKLYGFQENLGEELKLVNNTIFIDIDTKIYSSDIISTFLGKIIKDDLYIGDLNTLYLKDKYLFGKQNKKMNNFKYFIYLKYNNQRKLEKIMNYFSRYLNNRC